MSNALLLGRGIVARNQDRLTRTPLLLLLQLLTVLRVSPRREDSTAITRLHPSFTKGQFLEPAQDPPSRFTLMAHLQQWERKSVVNLLSSKSAPSTAGAGAEEATSTSIAAVRLRLAPASPPLGEPAGAAEAAPVARVEGDRTRYPSRDPLAPPGLPCCGPGRGASSLRDEDLRFVAGKNCGGGRSREASGHGGREGNAART